MARSLIRQYEQIRNSETYSDLVVDVNTLSVAQPSVSGTLEDDLNVLRTLLKDTKGTANWYGDLGNYFDPTNTTSGSVETKALNLNNLKNNTLDAKTIIVGVTADNSGSGYTVASGTAGVLITPTSSNYADPVNRTGLPIFASTANNGSYFDEGGADRVCKIDVIDNAVGTTFQNSDGHVVYAKFHDGADFGGSGENTDAYVRFYANGSVYTLDENDPTNVSFIYPYRRRLSDMAEYEWQRTEFIDSWEGDVELIEDINNLWSFTGASDGDESPQPWTNTSSDYILDSDPDNLRDAIDTINTEVGARTYLGSTYLTTDETITASLLALEGGIESNDTDIFNNSQAISTNSGDISDLEAAVGSASGLAGLDYSSNNYVTDNTSLETAVGTLDTELQRVEDLVDASSGIKYVESPSSSISKNTFHPLPAGLTYTPNSTAGYEGANMDVYVDGQLLAADTGVNGANADRDYGETTVFWYYF
jgi:hypothetical protein